MLFTHKYLEHLDIIKVCLADIRIICCQDTEERSVAVAVRIHRTLELADDKYYMITCGKAILLLLLYYYYYYYYYYYQAGFQNLHNQTSLVTLQLLREGRKVQQVVYGREYMLRWLIIIIIIIIVITITIIV